MYNQIKIRFITGLEFRVYCSKQRGLEKFPRDTGGLSIRPGIWNAAMKYFENNLYPEIKQEMSDYQVLLRM